MVRCRFGGGGDEGCRVYTYRARPISRRRPKQTDVLTANLSSGRALTGAAPLGSRKGEHTAERGIIERPRGGIGSLYADVSKKKNPRDKRGKKERFKRVNRVLTAAPVSAVTILL